MLHDYYITSMVSSFTFFVVISARPYTTEVGPDVLNARGSFPTDVHQVLIPRSHTHTHTQTHALTYTCKILTYMHTYMHKAYNYNAVRQKKLLMKSTQCSLYTSHSCSPLVYLAA